MPKVLRVFEECAAGGAQERVRVARPERRKRRSSGRARKRDQKQRKKQPGVHSESDSCTHLHLETDFIDDMRNPLLATVDAVCAMVCCAVDRGGGGGGAEVCYMRGEKRFGGGGTWRAIMTNCHKL